MDDSTDMSIPVTRGEFLEAFAQLEVRLERLEQRLEQKFEQKLDHLATKVRVELEIWGGALLARIEAGERRQPEWAASLEQRLLTDLARHTKAACEMMAMQISAIDDKYAELPGRVSRLEATVFPPRLR